MKAKDYVKVFEDLKQARPLRGDLYPDAPFDEAKKPADDADLVIETCRRVVAEFKTLARVRNAQSPAALGAIVQELDQKWQAVCRRSNDPGFIPELFMMVVNGLTNEKPQI